MKPYRKWAMRVVISAISLVLLAAASLGIWDLYLIHEGKGALHLYSASITILTEAQKRPIIVFLFGAFVGGLLAHLLWPQILHE